MTMFRRYIRDGWLRHAGPIERAYVPIMATLTVLLLVYEIASGH